MMFESNWRFHPNFLNISVNPIQSCCAFFLIVGALKMRTAGQVMQGNWSFHRVRI